MCGVISAIMAKNGYTAPTTVWDGQDGFLRAYSYKDIWNEAKVSKEFGKRWEILLGLGGSCTNNGGWVCRWGIFPAQELPADWAQAASLFWAGL